MAKRSMSKKALNLSEHKSRLQALPPQASGGLSWVLAFGALAAALLLLFLLR